jgi:Protein of unknown function (DUF4058)
MPIHDWTRVDAGIFHAFHHEWISEISRALNRGLLPADYYALPEQVAGGLGPDVLTLQQPNNGNGSANKNLTKTGNVLLSGPRVRLQAETPGEFYRRKKSSVAIRHVSDDRIVAILEIISPGNKESKHAFRALIEKTTEFLECKIHMLLIDLFPPSKRDPNGIHGAIWSELTNEEFLLHAEKPLLLASYESALTVKAYVEPVAVGDRLIDMPLFLEPGAHVLVPLERTYQAAWDTVPARWQRVLAPSAT